MVQRGDSECGPGWSQGCGDKQWECKHIFEVRGGSSRMGNSCGIVRCAGFQLGRLVDGGAAEVGTAGAEQLLFLLLLNGGKEEAGTPVTWPYLYPGERGWRRECRCC